MEGESDRLESKEVPPKTTESSKMPDPPEVTTAKEEDLSQSSATKGPPHSQSEHVKREAVVDSNSKSPYVKEE